MATFTSKASGNWSSSGSTTWNEAGVPGAGDTATINSGHTVTVDVNTTVGATNAAAHAVAIGATNSSTFGTLRVATGVTLTLAGANATTATLMLINQYAHFEPQPGSTVLGNVASGFGSVVLNKGRLIATGTAGSPITFSIPAANVPSWATQVTGESWFRAGPAGYLFDPHGSIAVAALAHDWVSGAAGTGPGSSTDSSLSFASQSPAGILAVEVPSLAAVTGAGKYWVDYDRGLVFFYLAYTGGSASFSATYKYLVDSSAWRGWGIDTTQATAGNSLELSYCNFRYMGDQSARPALNCAGLRTATVDASRALSIRNCTVSNCYRFFSGYDLGNPGATTDAYTLPILDNTFGNCRGDLSTEYCLGLTYGASPGLPSSFLDISNNVLNQRYVFLDCTVLIGFRLAHQSISVAGNTGACGCFLYNSSPTQVTWPDSAVTLNTLTFPGNAVVGTVYPIVHFGGTPGHPASIDHNTLAAIALIGVAPYLNIDSNIIYKSYSFNVASPNGYNNIHVPSVAITNNLFYGPQPAAGSYDAYGAGGPYISLGYNYNAWYDGLQIINNEFLDHDGTASVGPNLASGAISLNGSADAGSVMVFTGVECVNNIVANGAYNWPGAGIHRYPNNATNKSPLACAQLDSNVVYQAGAPYVNVNRGGTFRTGLAKYNFAARNVTGVTLSQPGYAVAQPSGRSLAYAVHTPGVDETLAWGGGTPVQLVVDHGTSTGSNQNNTTNGVPGLLSGTLNDAGKAWTASTSGNLAAATCMAGNWVSITGGTGVGQHRMITSNTTTGLTVVPAWATVPDATSAYTIRQVEVTLSDASGAVQGITVTNTGISVGAASFGFSGGGGTGASATAIVGGYLNSQLIGGTVTGGGSGYTSAPAVTVVNGFGAAAAATLGSVQAGIDARLLPAASALDSGITLTFGDPGWPAVAGSDPKLTGLGALPTAITSLPGAADAANARFTAGSSALDAGIAQGAPARDYFGTPRPQGGAVDVGFYEARSGHLRLLVLMECN